MTEPHPPVPAPDPALSRALERALLRRQRLRDDPETSFYRLLHDGEGITDLTLERIGSVGVLSLYRAASSEQEQAWAQAAVQTAGLETVYLKRRPLEARHAANVQRDWLSPPEPIWGPAHPQTEALEQGVRYRFRPGADLSVGLFSDMRLGRAFLRRHVRGRLLNTFAYTCGFGLNAALEGHRATNLDASRKVLEWGMDNYRLNGLTPDPHDFVYGDVFDWLSRLGKRGERFGTVVLDPPSFSRGKTGVFRVERDYPDLVELALKVLEPGGLLVACTNHAGLSWTGFERMVAGGFARARRSHAGLERLGAGADYPSVGEGHLKVWALEG